MIIRYRQGKETFSFLKKNLEGIVVDGKTISFLTTGSVYEVDSSLYLDQEVPMDHFPDFFENYSFVANVGCLDLGDMIRDYAEIDGKPVESE